MRAPVERRTLARRRLADKTDERIAWHFQGRKGKNNWVSKKRLWHKSGESCAKVGHRRFRERTLIDTGKH